MILYALLYDIEKSRVDKVCIYPDADILFPIDDTLPVKVVFNCEREKCNNLFLRDKDNTYIRSNMLLM